MSRKRTLLSNNPFGFTTKIKSILETDRITREEMVRLPCRASHRINPRSLKIPEDDNLYAIYAERVGKSTSFMRSWLRCYSISNDSVIKRRAKDYFKSKGLSLKLWLSAVREGRKGDILSLYTLSLMLDIHTVVHLNKGKIWSTLKSPINDHDELMKRCPVHLAYLGMGIFVELVERERPLQILPPEHSGKKDTEALIIGEYVVKQEPTEMVSEGEELSLSILKKQALTRNCSVILDRLEPERICQSRQSSRIIISHSTKPMEPFKPDEVKDPGSPTSSESTIIYDWQEDQRLSDSHRATGKKSKCKCKKTKAFSINTVGIRRRKPRYWFKCKVPPCQSSFSTIVGWNFHHRYAHKSVYLKCPECERKFNIPSAHRAHKNAHVEKKHSCEICNKSFPFKSGLRQHMQKHAKVNRHHCFAGKCKKSYKWASDLIRHVHTHLDTVLSCGDCNYTTKEARLLKRHEAKHSDIYRYKCKYCNFKTKWPTPYSRHLSTCKSKKC